MSHGAGTVMTIFALLSSFLVGFNMSALAGGVIAQLFQHKRLSDMA